MLEYGNGTDAILDRLPALTERQYAWLALACLDQAGLDVRTQQSVADLVSHLTAESE